MIHRDEHGNALVVMPDGHHVPLVIASVTVKIETAMPMVDGSAQIVSAVDAIAIHQTAARYWYQRYQEAKTQIADLRAQLTQQGDG